MPRPTPFDRESIEAAFVRIGQRALEAGKVVEITVYGGSALVLTFNARPATRDVDAVFEADRAFLRDLAKQIAVENGWDEGWLNDGVKGFLSHADRESDSRRLFRSYPTEEGAGLRVFVATPAYLFAMKCIAMRISGVEESRDVEDIKLLAAEIGVRTLDDAIAIVENFYPADRIPPRTRFGLEEIVDKIGDTSPS
ncbi:MAG: hypothetical protein MI920_33105 [Kiloniellales bacterium]|nr:hypothetical protein [Kiloniellales bacterium]